MPSADHPPAPVLCDLDGVVWLAHEPIAGSVDAIARLRNAGHRVLFVTNNSFARLAEHEAALERIGIPARGDVIGSASAAATLVLPGERVHVCAGPGVVEAVEARGATVVGDGPADAVVVGFHRSFDYESLRRAATTVRLGARLVGTNDDATFPTPDGLIPGGGALLAAVATAAGVVPMIAGKPHPPIANLVRSALGDVPIGEVVMVGDRVDTDGRFASELGCRFALVRTGVTSELDASGPRPDIVADDLAAVADALVCPRSPRP